MSEYKHMSDPFKVENYGFSNRNHTIGRGRTKNNEDSPTYQRTSSMNSNNSSKDTHI